VNRAKRAGRGKEGPKEKPRKREEIKNRQTDGKVKKQYWGTI